MSASRPVPRVAGPRPDGPARCARGGAAGRGSVGQGRPSTRCRASVAKRTLRRIAAFFRPYRRQVGVVLVAILTTSVLGLVNPYLLGLISTRSSSARTTPT